MIRKEILLKFDTDVLHTKSILTRICIFMNMGNKLNLWKGMGLALAFLDRLHERRYKY